MSSDYYLKNQSRNYVLQVGAIARKKKGFVWREQAYLTVRMAASITVNVRHIRNSPLTSINFECSRRSLFHFIDTSTRTSCSTSTLAGLLITNTIRSYISNTSEHSHSFLPSSCHQNSKAKVLEREPIQPPTRLQEQRGRGQYTTMASAPRRTCVRFRSLCRASRRTC